MRHLLRKNPLTTANLQLDEACTLIETLPMWKVVDKVNLTLLHIWLCIILMARHSNSI